MVQVMKVSPPYVRFGYEEVEDREASIEKGYYVGKQVPFAYLTPSGSKDVIPRNAVEWLTQIKESARNDAFPREWVREYELAFEEWKKTDETPEFGTPIKTWPVLSPQERAAVLHANIRTVEDLAAASEQGIGAIGMSGRTIKQRAIDWLESASGSGKVTAQLETLRVENEMLKATVAGLQETVERLKPAKTAKAA